jgi:hypothetical protein
VSIGTGEILLARLRPAELVCESRAADLAANGERVAIASLA